MIDSDANPPPAIGELLESARPTLRRVLARFQIPAEDAEDLLQETSILYLRKHEEVREPLKWLAGALRNECRLYWRRRSRKRDHGVDQAVLDLLTDEKVKSQEQHALERRIEELIASLDPRCRTILSLRYRLGYNDSEVAERTGYSPASIDKIARRCVTALSRRLLGTGVTRRLRHG